ncbi:hypothetical protein E1B28_001801 [Marasmius oreades]|uniref:Uncharacterized protein n=1 Tax=Marasmius oreades TaxID=181124 RepID=A0A9P7V453_9AGAR|nr:uncharacterized protein E1B28_001801 [Marasmius oreades]KAG7100014.1 hypothetical protein E1B28_001801 [Marasmius oreades]
MSSSSSPPPSYSSKDMEACLGKEEKEQSATVDHEENGGHSPSRSSNHSLYSGGDDKEERNSIRSREKRRSHRSSRHHHQRDDKSSSPKPAASVKDLSEKDLDRIARKHMRRSQLCGPEFLEELAKNGAAEGYEEDGQKFRVVAGSEARSIYNEVLREDAERTIHDFKPEITPSAHSRDHRHGPVVFAFPVHTPATLRAGGRKVVDYYMTWKGKTGTHHLKGERRKKDFLEPEFMKIAQGLDEYVKNRLSTLSTSPLEENGKGKDESNQPTMPTSHSAPPAPQSIDDSGPLIPPRPPGLSASLRDSNPSVLSLPYLGATGARSPLLLRVTNPDPASSSGSDSKRASLVVEPLTSSATKRTHKKHDEASKPSGKHTSSLEPVVEDDESSRKHRHKHRRSRREANGSSESLSGSSTSSSRKKKRSKDEILIVLLDSDHEKDKVSRLKRNNSARLPSRRTSTRSSPWNAPAATSNGEIHRYVPGVHDEPDDDEDSSGEEGELPRIPMESALKALGLHPHNSSMPNLAHPSHPSQQPTPASIQSSLHVASPYRRSTTLPTPMSIHQALPPTSSPYHLGERPEIYSTPYSFSTPNLPHAHSSPASPLGGAHGSLAPNTSYVMPWVSPDYASTPIPTVGSLPPGEHPAASASVYSSPYVPPVQAPYPYSNAGTPSRVPLQIYASPNSAMNRTSPFVGASGSGAGGGMVPLPALSVYAPSPCMRSEAQLY